MKLQELFEAKEGFKLYVQHPYGHGYDRTPVKVGEILPAEDDDHWEFVGITDDGKKVILKHDKTGEEKIEMAMFVDGKILPASEKPSGEGFMLK